MKKKILGGIAVLAIAAFNVNINTQEEGLSAISMDNVEALASESGGGVTLPCTSSSGNTCSFQCTTADGTKTCTVSNHKNI